MKTRLGKFAAATLTAGALLFTVACGSGASYADVLADEPADGPQEEDGTAAPEVDGGTPAGHLRLAAQSAPETWDVNGKQSAMQFYHFSAVFDTLLRMDGNTELAPGLAHSWDISEDRMSITLELHEGIEFTDGTPFNAEAAVANIENFKASTSPEADTAASIESVVATGDYTVEINLVWPDPDLAWNLTRGLGMVSSPSSWENADVGTNPVGTGPYILDTGATVVGATYVFHANPNYWDDTWQRFEQVTITIITDRTALTNAFLGDQLDAGVFNGDPAVVPQLEGAGFSAAPFGVDTRALLLLDRDGTIVPELANPLVRQAINYAIDREGLVEVFESGWGTPSSQMFRDPTVAFDAGLSDRYPFDPDRARELLAEAGVGEFSVRMPLSPFAPEAQLTQVQQQLANVGITLEFYAVSAPEAMAQATSGNFGLIFMNLDAVRDWTLINTAMLPGSRFNPNGVERPEVNAMIETIRTGTTAESEQAMRDLNRYMVEEAWFAPLFFVETPFLTNDTVTDARSATTVTIPAMYHLSPAS